MQRGSWFDENSRELFKNALAEKDKELEAYIKDGKIGKQELNKQLHTIIYKLKAIEPKLSDDIYRELWDILQDFYVYSEMCLRYENPERIATRLSRSEGRRFIREKHTEVIPF